MCCAGGASNPLLVKSRRIAPATWDLTTAFWSFCLCRSSAVRVSEPGSLFVVLFFLYIFYALFYLKAYASAAGPPGDGWQCF